MIFPLTAQAFHEYVNVFLRCCDYFGHGIEPTEISFLPCVLVYGDHIEKLGQTEKTVGMGRLMLLHKKSPESVWISGGLVHVKDPREGSDGSITGNLNKMGKRQTGYALRIGCVSASLRSISLRLR